MQNEKAEFKNDFQRRVYLFVLSIIHLIDDMSRDRQTSVLTDQLLRSSTSVGANVIEARSSSSRKDYTNFFSIALKSANETVYWLELLRDSGKTDKDRANKAIKEASEIAKVLASSILTLKGRK